MHGKSDKRIHDERAEVRMKVVILAGGKGTRISEESKIRPKPMVEIGGKPILWHMVSMNLLFAVAIKGI